MSDAPTKPCNHCGEEYPLTAYHLHPHNHDGRANVCPECKRKQRAKAEKGLLNANRYCGVCSADIEPEWKGVMLCKAHRPRQTSHEGDTCSRCQFEMQCCIRVHNGIWVLCEIPDEFDIKRARAASIPVTFDKRVLRREVVTLEMEER